MSWGIKLNFYCTSSIIEKNLLACVSEIVIQEGFLLLTLEKVKKHKKSARVWSAGYFNFRLP